MNPRLVDVIALHHGSLYRLKNRPNVGVSTVDNSNQLCHLKGPLTRCGVCFNTGGAAGAQLSGS